jgi:hypothetical protein
VGVLDGGCGRAYPSVAAVSPRLLLSVLVPVFVLISLLVEGVGRSRGRFRGESTGLCRSIQGRGRGRETCHGEREKEGLVMGSR